MNFQEIEAVMNSTRDKLKSIKDRQCFINVLLVNNSFVSVAIYREASKVGGVTRNWEMQSKRSLHG